jgi:hypothetical protein
LYPGAGDARFVKLIPRPGSDEVMALVLDSSSDLSALVWNGSSFGNKVLLAPNAASATCEAMDGAYEGTSGRCVVAWGVAGSDLPAYRIWTGSAWLTAGSLPDVGGTALWVRLAADRASDTVIAMTLDDSTDVNTCTWNGSAWGAVTQLATNSAANDRRSLDISFEPAGARALAIYRQGNGHSAHYRTCSGGSWSGSATTPTISQPVGVVAVAPVAAGSEALVGIRRQADGALCFMRWTGSGMTDYQVLAPILGGSTGTECFMFSDAPAQTRILTWQETNPD